MHDADSETLQISILDIPPILRHISCNDWNICKVEVRDLRITFFFAHASRSGQVSMEVHLSKDFYVTARWKNVVGEAEPRQLKQIFDTILVSTNLRNSLARIVLEHNHVLFPLVPLEEEFDVSVLSFDMLECVEKLMTYTGLEILDMPKLFHHIFSLRRDLLDRVRSECISLPKTVLLCSLKAQDLNKVFLISICNALCMLGIDVYVYSDDKNFEQNYCSFLPYGKISKPVFVQSLSTLNDVNFDLGILVDHIVSRKKEHVDNFIMLFEKLQCQRWCVCTSDVNGYKELYRDESFFHTIFVSMGAGQAVVDPRVFQAKNPWCSIKTFPKTHIEFNNEILILGSVNTRDYELARELISLMPEFTFRIVTSNVELLPKEIEGFSNVVIQESLPTSDLIRLVHSTPIVLTLLAKEKVSVSSPHGMTAFLFLMNGPVVNIVSDSPAARWYIDDEQDGIIVPVDTIDVLITKIKGLLKESNIRKSIAEKRYQRFLKESCLLRQIIEILRVTM